MSVTVGCQYAAAFVVAALVGCFAAPAVAEHSPRNVLVIVADDLGWTDLGCYGSDFYETPAIDGLAAGGVRFTNGYASCPVCSPSRASLMTGKSPARLGLTAHIGAPQPEQYGDKTRLLPASYRSNLPLGETTLGEVFHDAGYATFFAGKWHLGSDDRHWPEYQGFDQNVGGWSQGGPFGGKQYFSPYGNPRLPNGPPGEHLPDRLATETTRFIDTHRHKPFFAVLSFYSVHVPLVAREDLRQKYERKRNPFGEYDRPIWGVEPSGVTRVRMLHDSAVYAAMIEAMDQAVGKVLKKLDELELADDTVVVFTSDNGGLSTGDRAISADQGWPTSNRPLRAGKGWLYEGGVRVPLVIRAPGANAGSENGLPVSGEDLFPTIASLAGLEEREHGGLDGIDVSAAVRGDPMERGALYWHYPHFSNQGGGPGSAIREGDWKLIQWFETDRVELYNLAEDVGEVRDLAEVEVERRDDMLAKLVSWRGSMGAKLPQPNPKAELPQTSQRPEAKGPEIK